jgi:hypothetical protein
MHKNRVKRPRMSVIETYRVVTGTTRALLHFERSDEVCECVAEMILERRRRAGVRSPPAAGRKIALALRDGVARDGARPGAGGGGGGGGGG